MRNRSISGSRSPIRQPAAGNEGPYTLLFDVWLLARVTLGVLDAAIADSGINADEFALYSLIRVEGPLTPTELARWTAIPLTTLSSQVRRLERRGHIQRVPHGSDRRSYRIDLTDAGRSAHALASERCLPVLRQVEKALSRPPGKQRSALKELEHLLREAGALPAPVSRARPTPPATSLYGG